MSNRLRGILIFSFAGVLLATLLIALRFGANKSNGLSHLVESSKGNIVSQLNSNDLDIATDGMLSLAIKAHRMTKEEAFAAIMLCRRSKDKLHPDYILICHRMANDNPVVMLSSLNALIERGEININDDIDRLYVLGYLNNLHSENKHGTSYKSIVQAMNE